MRPGLIIDGFNDEPTKNACRHGHDVFTAPKTLARKMLIYMGRGGEGRGARNSRVARQKNRQPTTAGFSRRTRSRIASGKEGRRKRVKKRKSLGKLYMSLPHCREGRVREHPRGTSRIPTSLFLPFLLFSPTFSPSFLPPSRCCRLVRGRSAAENRHRHTSSRSR